jgi:tetratricopeptide (TPR) repeat protein
LNNLGVALRRERRYEESIAYLQHAMELQPANIELRRNLAISLRGLERYKDAIEHYEAVLAKQPNDEGMLYDLANCHEKLGDNANAIKTYKRYVQVVRAKDPAAAERADQRIKALEQTAF